MLSGEDSGVIDKRLFYNSNGHSDCLNLCYSLPNCQSFNLAESRPGEWYCEPTEFTRTDTAYAVPQELDGFDNYSFTVSKVPYILKYSYIFE